MNPYGDLIHDHARHPRNHGPLAAPDLRAEDVNPFCGDRVRIELTVDAHGNVSAAGFQGDLCAIARAASSLLTELVIARSLADLHAFDDAMMLHALQTDVPATRVQCAMLPLRVLHQALVMNEALTRPSATLSPLTRGEGQHKRHL